MILPLHIERKAIVILVCCWKFCTVSDLTITCLVVKSMSILGGLLEVLTITILAVVLTITSLAIKSRSNLAELLEALYIE